VSGLSAIGTVAIVGAGQVGTMLGMALRRAAPHHGVEEIGLLDRDPRTASESLARGAGDRLLAAPEEALWADTLILALPVPEIVRFLEERGRDMGAGSLVVDTGSAKRAVVEAMRASVPPPVHAVGGHPMAGTERPGPEGADPDSLRDAPFVLSPVRDDPEALARGRVLAAALSARPVEMKATVHDRVVARTSHLPHLMASALALVVGGVDVDSGEEVRSLVGGGDMGATRLARSDPSMVAGFLSANADELRTAVRELGVALEKMVSALDEGLEPLSRILTDARAETARVAGPR
jgi:prephenate dehydrogenase